MTTVTGNVITFEGAGLSTPITVLQVGPAQRVGSSFVPRQEAVIQSDANGNFAVDLEPGNYEFIFNGRSRVLAVVPAEGAYDLSQLVVSTLPSASPVTADPCTCSVATNTAAGLVLVDVEPSNGPPLVYTKATVDAMFAALAPTGNFTCHGEPDGQVTASPGAYCLDLDSGVQWVKQTGVNTNTGWI